MKPTIFCDYGNTLSTYSHYSSDRKTAAATIVLLDTLQAMKNNGAPLFLATDGSAWDGERYIQSLYNNVKAGYFEDKPKSYDLFSEIITKDTFNIKKDSYQYWPTVMEHYSLNSNEIILLDDNKEILRMAANFGITTISSLPREDATYNLFSIYNLMCNQ